MTPAQWRTTRMTAGGALIVMGLALCGARLLEFASRGQIDGDNPAASLDYLAEQGDAYVVTGILLLMLAAALVVAAVAVRAVLRAERPSLWVDACAVAGAIAAGALGLAGVTRVSAPGPLAYISSLNAGWGESAYLVVQMAGNQTLFAGGLLGMSIWLAGLAIAAWRRRSVARGALVLAVFALDFILAVAGPLIEIPDALFGVHLFSIMVGVPFACAAIGGAFLVRGARAPETTEG
ncbi:MAG: hypothetical protein ABIQ01_05595 [Pseudolysinimonas sp.]